MMTSKTISRSRTVLVDADGLLYIAGAAGETRTWDCDIYSGETGHYYAQFDYVADLNEHLEMTGDILVEKTQRIIQGELSHCLHVVKQTMQGIVKRYGKRLEVYVKGDGTNFRDDISTLVDYKANRTTEKPYYLEEIRQYMINTWNAIPVNGKEADDMIATRAFEASGPYVVCSPDKDLDQIPGLHWNYSKKVEYDVSEWEAQYFFWQQCLSGDSADHIKGCWRIGPGTAKKLLDEWLKDDPSEADIWEMIVEEYEASMGKGNCPYAGMPAEMVAIENARLVWMQTENLRLWTPPGAPPEYLEGGLDD